MLTINCDLHPLLNRFDRRLNDKGEPTEKRTPVLLAEEDFDAWLDASAGRAPIYFGTFGKDDLEADPAPSCVAPHDRAHAARHHRLGALSAAPLRAARGARLSRPTPHRPTRPVLEQERRHDRDRGRDQPGEQRLGVREAVVAGMREGVADRGERSDHGRVAVAVAVQPRDRREAQQQREHAGGQAGLQRDRPVRRR